MKLQITDAAHKRILAVDDKQSQNAKALGVLLWEYETKRAAAMTNIVDLKMLGQIEYEFQQRKDFFIRTIRLAEEEQRMAGEIALREAGIDPASGDYTIRGRGIYKLERGDWKEEF